MERIGRTDSPNLNSYVSLTHPPPPPWITGLDIVRQSVVHLVANLYAVIDAQRSKLVSQYSVVQIIKRTAVGVISWLGL